MTKKAKTKRAPKKEKKHFKKRFQGGNGPGIALPLALAKTILKQTRHCTRIGLYRDGKSNKNSRDQFLAKKK